MKTTKIKKLQKPIDMSLNLIYRCPECSNQHWLSLNQAKTKKFIVVCDCGCIFKVKPVKDIKVVYQQKVVVAAQTAQQQNTTETTKPAPEKKQPEISEALLDSCTKALKPYGFTSTECHPIIKECFKNNPKFTAAEIIKFCLTTIGSKNG